MNRKEEPKSGVQVLFALRKEADTLHVITEYLKVKEMGPSDHIRTKHEAKAFIESGDATVAENLLKRADERRKQRQEKSVKEELHQGERMGQ